MLTTRQSDDDGRLNLVPQIGKVPLSDAVLIEDPSEQGAVDDDGNYLFIDLTVNDLFHELKINIGLLMDKEKISKK